MAKIPAKLKTLAEEALAGNDPRLTRAVRRILEDYLSQLHEETTDKEEVQRLLDADGE